MCIALGIIVLYRSFCCNQNNFIMLLQAIQNNDLIGVQNWIDHRRQQQPDHLDCRIGQQQQDALHCAAKYNKVEIARKLIEAGASRCYDTSLVSWLIILSQS